MFDYKDKVNNTYLHTYVAYLVCGMKCSTAHFALHGGTLSKKYKLHINKEWNTKMGTKLISFCDTASRGGFIHAQSVMDGVESGYPWTYSDEKATRNTSHEGLRRITLLSRIAHAGLSLC